MLAAIRAARVEFIPENGGGTGYGCGRGKTLMEPEHAMAFIKPFLNMALTTGHYTHGFLSDLAICIGHDDYDPYAIINEIAILEGSRSGHSGTKPAAVFKRKYLKGLWHKHHTQSRFMIKNLFDEMIRDGTVEKFLKPYEGQVLTEDIFKRLSHTLVVDNYVSRAKDARLTGEWIVFSKTPTGNHYLTLANHTDGDKEVADRIAAYRAIDMLLPPMAG
jgi:hypothetical protein